MGKTNLDIPNEKEQEVGKIFTEKWYDWQKTKKGLEGIEINEKTAKELESLKSDVKEYAERLKGLYVETYKKEPEKISEEKISDTLKNTWEQSVQLAENAENKALDAAEEQILKKAEWLKEIPLVWDFLYDYAKDILWETKKSLEPNPNEKAWDRFIRKMKIWFWSVILSLFWFKWIKEFLNTKKDWNQDDHSELDKNDWEIYKNLENFSEENREEDTPEKKVEVKEKISEAKENIFGKYSWWFEFLLWSVWYERNSNTWHQSFLNWLKNVEYKDFIENWWTEDFRENHKINDKKLDKDYEEIRKYFASKNMKTLFKVSLKPEKVKKILLWINLDKPNEKLKKEFWEERFNKILEIIENWEFNYEKLTISELSILYINTIPLIANWSISKVKGIFWDIIPEISSEVLNIKSDPSDFFSDELIGKIILNSWWKENLEANISTESLFEKLWLKSGNEELDKKNFEDLEKLVNYKDYLKTEFLEEKALWLTEDEKERFKENLNYKYILSFYSITWWEKNLSELDWTNLMFLALLVAKVLWGWEAMNSASTYNYLRRFVVSIAKWPNLSADQKEILLIYWKRIIQSLTNPWIKEMARILWLMWIKDKETAQVVSVWSAIASYWSFKLWWKLTAKSLSKYRWPLLWRTFNMAGWWFVLFSVFTWWASLIMEKWDLKLDASFDELTKLYDSWLDNPDDLEKAINLLDEKLDSSINLWKVNFEWKEQEVGISYYKDSSPLVIIDWKSYILWIYWESVPWKALWYNWDPITSNNKRLYPISIWVRNWKKSIIFWESWVTQWIDAFKINLENAQKKEWWDWIDSLIWKVSWNNNEYYDLWEISSGSTLWFNANFKMWLIPIPEPENKE